MVEWLDWFFPTIVGNGTLILIVAGAAGWFWSRMQLWKGNSNGKRKI